LQDQGVHTLASLHHVTAGAATIFAAAKAGALKTSTDAREITSAAPKVLANAGPKAVRASGFWGAHTGLFATLESTMPTWRDDRREEERITVPVRRVAPAWPATRGANRMAGAGIGDIKAAAPEDSARSAAPFASIEEAFFVFT